MSDEEYNDEQHGDNEHQSEHLKHNNGEQTTDNQQHGDDEHYDEYEVGYCKPPKKNQFPKGVSGNSSGRPRKKKNFRSLIHNELEKKVKLKGSNETKTLKEVLGISLINNAIEGKTKALDKLLPIVLDSEDPEGFELFQRDINMIKRLDENIIYDIEEPEVKDEECDDDEDGTGTAVVPT